jgi:predicted nucleic acid-binding protein
LVLCGAIEVLPRFFERVIIPTAVVAELQHTATPGPVRQWISLLPPWTEVRRPLALDPHLRIGAGETEAIALAIELKVAAILVDDDKARRVAIHKGLSTLGTLAILEKAAEQNWLDLPTAVSALRRTNFHIHPRLLDEALARHEQRLHAQGVRHEPRDRRNPRIDP